MSKTMYPELEAMVARRGISRSKIARALGITYRSFYNKMTGRSPLGLTEATTIQSQFFPDITLEDLFRQG